jgi:hypothetical protein
MTMNAGELLANSLSSGKALASLSCARAVLPHLPTLPSRPPSFRVSNAILILPPFLL